MKKPYCRCSTGFYIRLSLSQVLVGKVNSWKKFQIINFNLETPRIKFVNVFRGVVKTQSCLKTIFIFEVTSDFWNQKCLIWVFWAVILKNHCQIWNQSPRVYSIANFYSKFKILLFGTKMLYLGIFFARIKKKKLFSCMKPPPSNPSICKTLLRNKNAKTWDQSYRNWVLLNCNLKMIFSYLKSASSNLFNCKISWKKQKFLIWVFFS